MAQKFQALREFGYGGATRLPGEVFDRMYLRNDDRLMREDTGLRYVRVLTPEEIKDQDQVHCDQCGRDFGGEHFYHAHLPVAHGATAAGEAPPPTRIEDEHPGGIMVDATGRPAMRPARR